MTSLTEQRKALDDIIMRKNGTYWYIRDNFEQHTRKLLPQALEIIEAPPAEEQNHNCFIYMLNLQDETEIMKDCNGFIYSAFIKKLLDDGHLKQTNEPSSGNYIFYQELNEYPDEITHGGVLQEDGTVISKWAWGPLLKHEVLYVPASYGDTIWYTNSLSKADAIRLYWEHKDSNVRTYTVT